MNSTDMRSLSGQARHDRRAQVVALRLAGSSYDEIAVRTGLSRTGVFNICKRHQAQGDSALWDAPNGHKPGDGRLLPAAQETLLRELIAHQTPEQLGCPGLLWTPEGVASLLDQRLGLRLAARTLRLYLARWGYAGPRRMHQADAADAATAPALRHWLDHELPAIEARAQLEDAEIHWAHETSLPGFGQVSAHWLLSTVCQRGRRHWMCIRGEPGTTSRIDFLRRLTTDVPFKVFLIRNMPDQRGLLKGALSHWLAEQDESIVVFELPLSSSI